MKGIAGIPKISKLTPAIIIAVGNERGRGLKIFKNMLLMDVQISIKVNLIVTSPINSKLSKI